jgi:hypothetical protein
MNKFLMCICFFISGVITLLFMVGFAEGQNQLTTVIIILMGVVLEVSKIKFVYEWSIKNENKFLAFMSILLVSISIFFSYLFTSNLSMENREKNKIVSEEYKDFDKKIKNLNSDKKLILKDIEDLKIAQKKELKDIPKNWISNKKEIKDYYKPLISEKDNELKSINNKINHTINLKPDKYNYIISKGFNPIAIKNSPILGDITKDIPDNTIIQFLSILFGLIIEVVGVVITFLSGKNATQSQKDKGKNVNEKLLEEINKLKQAIETSKQEQENKQTSTQAKEQARKQVNTINLDKYRDKQEQANKSKQENTLQIETSIQANKINTQASTSSIILQDYTFMNGIITFLKDYKNQKFPKKIVMEKFNLSNTQYRKVMEYLKENNMIQSTGNSYKVI